MERYVELASSLIMKEWRRLPSIVSHIHLPLLQAAQQVSNFISSICFFNTCSALANKIVALYTVYNNLQQNYSDFIV